MKHLKILGLALVAGAALTVSAGGGTAAATVICTTTTTPCPVTYGEGELDAQLVLGTKAAIKTEFKTIECSKSTVASFIVREGSATTTVETLLSKVTFQECNCEVKVLREGWLEIHHISKTDNGTLTSDGLELTANCSTIFGTVHCIYATFNTDLGTFTGENFPKLDIEASLPRLSTSGLCSAEAKWVAQYQMSIPLGALYIEPS